MRFMDAPCSPPMIERAARETVYFLDVRTAEEHAAGHIPGFRWFPGGQAVQRSDELAVVKNCPIVFACDGTARATITASWFRQMGFTDVPPWTGARRAWEESGRALE